jgi:hypothetical protein
MGLRSYIKSSLLRFYHKLIESSLLRFYHKLTCLTEISAGSAASSRKAASASGWSI